MEEAAGGFVIIENVEQMSAKCLEKVIAYIRSGTYTVRGDNLIYHSKTRLILTVCENSCDMVENALLQVVPVVCKLPPLDKIYPIEIKKAKIPNHGDKNFAVLNKLGMDVKPGIILCMADEMLPYNRDTWFFPVSAL